METIAMAPAVLAVCAALAWVLAFAEGSGAAGEGAKDRRRREGTGDEGPVSDQGAWGEDAPGTWGQDSAERPEMAAKPGKGGVRERVSAGHVTGEDPRQTFNHACPIDGDPVDPDVAVRRFENRTVGFCSEEDLLAWDELDDEEKRARIEQVEETERAEE